MNRKVFWTAALWLILAAGCSTPGGPSPGLAGRFKPLSHLSWADSHDGSFAEAVKNDPFPRAGAPQMQVAVHR